MDCFLFMISTGMYFADIKKSKLGFDQSDGTTCIQYIRAKCETLGTGIPVGNDEVFIGKQIIAEYGIRPGLQIEKQAGEKNICHCPILRQENAN